MADIVFNPVAGVPFSGGTRMKDLGDGTFAPLSMSVAGPVPLLSITNQSALSTAGVALDNTGVRNNHSLFVIPTGTCSGGTVQLQGSQDNINWVNLLGGSGFQQTPITPATGVIAVGTAQLSPFRYIRAFISLGITGGGNISAYVASAG